MKKLTASILGVVMILGVSSPAFAIHQCGQLLGSCLVHIRPVPIIKTPVIKPVEPVVIIEPARPIKTN